MSLSAALSSKRCRDILIGSSNMAKHSCFDLALDLAG